VTRPPILVDSHLVDAAPVEETCRSRVLPARRAVILEPSAPCSPPRARACRRVLGFTADRLSTTVEVAHEPGVNSSASCKTAAKSVSVWTISPGVRRHPQMLRSGTTLVPAVGVLCGERGARCNIVGNHDGLGFSGVGYRHGCGADRTGGGCRAGDGDAPRRQLDMRSVCGGFCAGREPAGADAYPVGCGGCR
jgi:hypothetical protein